jgi:hypothetical protein
MSGQTPSWGDLRPQQVPDEPEAPDRFSLLCAIVFTTPSGKELLDELRRRHIDRRMTPGADERSLRVAATEQHLVRGLELARDRGLVAVKKST